MTNSANPSLELGESIFKTLVWDSLIKAGIGVLFAEVPILAIWPLNLIISGIINMMANALFKQLKLVVDVNAISFVNDQHRKDFDQESVKLRIIAHDKGIDSPEFKAQKELAAQSLAKYVKYNAQ